MDEFVAQELTYWVAHGDGRVVVGKAAAGEHVATALPHLETFGRYRPWRARVLELGGNPDEVTL